MNTLAFHFKKDSEDYDVELHIIFNDFSANSGAFFTRSDLLDFCQELSSYPLHANPSISGGIIEGGEVVPHVALSLSERGNRGQLLLKIKLGSQYASDDDPTFKLEAVLPFEYESANVLSRKIEQGINNDQEEFQFKIILAD